MKNLTIQKLKENFCGKICTVLTKTVAKTNFKDQQFADFFTGVIDSIDEDGIFSKHHITNCVSFFPLDHVVGILEEQVILDSDPSFEKISQEINEAKKANSVEIPIDDSKFINPDFMAVLAQNAKRAQEK